MLGVLASNNLWELPTYAGLALLALLVYQVRCYGRIRLGITLAAVASYLLGGYLFFLPFFQHYAPVGASGVGLVAQGDPPGLWLRIWGFFLFILLSWLLFVASRPLHRDRLVLYEPQSGATVMSGAPAPLAGERLISQALRRYERLPRLVYWQRILVKFPSLGFLMTPTVVFGCWLLAAIAWFLGWSVLALCLAPLGLLLVLLWRRSREADAATLLVTLLFTVGLLVLTGTQPFYLKDFLAGSPAYRINTVFKFFSQVWVLWSVAAAIAVYQVWNGWMLVGKQQQAAVGKLGLRVGWRVCVVLLIVASLAYPLFGTPDRLQMA